MAQIPALAMEKLFSALSLEEIRSLADRCKIDLDAPKGPVSLRVSSSGHAELPSHFTPLTPKQLVSNDRHVTPLPVDRINVIAFYPEIRNLKPAGAIRHLLKKFKDTPSSRNSLLLQCAINQSGSSADGDLKHAIHEAKAAFQKGVVQAGGSGGLDDIWFEAWVDANYGKNSLIAVLPATSYFLGEIYVRSWWNAKISSLKCGSYNEAGGWVILLQNADYQGKYQCYVAPPSGETNAVPYVGNGFNDITSSYLIIRRGVNETSPIFASLLFPPLYIQQLVTQPVDLLTGTLSGLEYNGVTYTWDLWPTGPKSSNDWHPNEPTKTYILLYISCYVPTDKGNYNSQIRLW